MGVVTTIRMRSISVPTSIPTYTGVCSTTVPPSTSPLYTHGYVPLYCTAPAMGVYALPSDVSVYTHIGMCTTCGTHHLVCVTPSDVPLHTWHAVHTPICYWPTTHIWVWCTAGIPSPAYRNHTCSRLPTHKGVFGGVFWVVHLGCAE